VIVSEVAFIFVIQSGEVVAEGASFVIRGPEMGFTVEIVVVSYAVFVVPEKASFIIVIAVAAVIAGN
jgi:hypothetical protein